MFIKVVLGEYSRGEEQGEVHHPSSEVLVNLNCPIRIIYDYIQQCFNIESEYEFDLCDDIGNLVFIYEKEPWTYGTDYLLARTIYYVVLFERDEEKSVTNPLICLPEPFKKSPSQLNEMMTNIKRQINPFHGSKTSSFGKSRSSVISTVK